MEKNKENNSQKSMDPDQDPIDAATDPKVKKRKALEALGCLLYVIAFVIMGSVLIVKLGKM